MSNRGETLPISGRKVAAIVVFDITGQEGRLGLSPHIKPRLGLSYMLLCCMSYEATAGNPGAEIECTILLRHQTPDSLCFDR